ncbi:uncharacterized protein LOC123531072 [Mercenaria mercenaria]|uniref:uncharacterized protein LOC123531072 n=1 Tax=Mercenaria mercenaria TaxID=6596 RepID=UPI00234F7604|nr:uncharacterized protein LOC123531072 [Mercenaria mercenaria]
MSGSDVKATESLAHKFKILNIKGLGHYRCYTKVLHQYLSGKPVNIQPAELAYRSVNHRIFTRQSSQRTTKCFSAFHKLSENEHFNKHSLCRTQNVKKSKEVSAQNILEYSYSGANRSCRECGLQVFELDFAFICSDCGHLIHKGCTDVCRRSKEKGIYPFCHINDLSDLINGFQPRKVRYKGPTKAHAEKCLPMIRPLHAFVTVVVNSGSEKVFVDKKRRQQMSSGKDLPQPSKRRKVTRVKATTKGNTQIRRSTRRNKICNTLNDASHKRLITKRCKTDRSGNYSKEETKPSNRTAIKEGISLFVSKTLNFLGYNYEMIKYRQRMYHVNDELTAQFGHQTDARVTTGGKGEGTTMYFESDIDYLFVLQQLICTDHPELFASIKNITVLETKRNMTSPGYTRLELVRFSGRYRRYEISASLIESQSGSSYLSSDRFIESLHISQDKICNRSGLDMGDRSGPSTPVFDKYTSYDDVIGLPCYCPDLLGKWLARPRYHNWPPQEVLYSISLLDAHAVPTGFKGSPDQYLEWRICFSLAELHLMQSLNECQIQTYILLKKIAKTCLQPISKDITSYVVKNTILWICEKTPISFFQTKHILDRFLDSIEFLRQCIRKNYLPSYMISERNLFPGRLGRAQKHQLERILFDLRREEGELFLRIGMLREAMLIMYKIPNRFREYGEKRDILERIVLMRNWIRESVWKPEMTKTEKYQLAAKNRAYNILEKEIDDILHVDMEKLLLKGWLVPEIFNLWLEMMHQLLS